MGYSGVLLRDLLSAELEWSLPVVVGSSVVPFHLNQVDELSRV